MSDTALRVLFSGNVQGVFFRATAREVAQRFAVTGFIRNLPDGRVEIVAEGNSAEIDAFVTAVQKAKSQNIRETQTEEIEPSGAYKDFAITH